MRDGMENPSKKEASRSASEILRRVEAKILVCGLILVILYCQFLLVLVFFDPDSGINALNDEFMNENADYLASPSELEDNFNLLASKRRYLNLIEKGQDT